LIDNHLHIIRGGLNFNMARWDGVRTLADAMNMLKRRSPSRLAAVGSRRCGFTEHQFAENDSRRSRR